MQGRAHDAHPTLATGQTPPRCSCPGGSPRIAAGSAVFPPSSRRALAEIVRGRVLSKGFTPDGPYSRDRRRRLPGVAPVRPPARRRARPALRGQLLHRQQAQYRPPPGPSVFRADAPRRDVPAVRRGRPDLQPRLPGLAGALPARPGADHQDQRPRRDQHAGPGQAAQGADPAGLHQRGLRRPGSASAAGRLLGPGQPHRHPQLLRRRQTLRRNPVLRLSPPARPRRQGRAHLQHLRPACTPTTAGW